MCNFNRRKCAISTDVDTDQIWSIRKTALVAEAWTLRGEEVEEYVFDVPWFKPWVQGNRLSATEPPKPVVTAARGDALGRLWLIVSVGDSAWKSAIKLTTLDGKNSVQPRDVARTFDSIVLVFDPREASIIAMRRFDQHLRTFCGDNCVVGLVDDGAKSLLQAWTLKLVGDANFNKQRK